MSFFIKIWSQNAALFKVNFYFCIRIKHLKIKALKKIQNALISVFHKDRLEPIVEELNHLGVTIYSTGGTQKFIEDLGGIVTSSVSKNTNYLVYGEKAGSKLDKAKKLNVETLTESDFSKLISK